MWIKKKKYLNTVKRNKELRRDIDSVIRVCSGLVCKFGEDRAVTIPIPSSDLRTLHWKHDDKGNITITSWIYGQEDRDFKMKESGNLNASIIRV